MRLLPAARRAPRHAPFHTPSRVSKRALLVAVLLSASLTAPGAYAATAHRKPAGKSIKLTSGTLTITFKPSVYAALTNASTPNGALIGNTLNSVAPASTLSAGVFTFPITAGNFNINARTGTVKTRGGLDFNYYYLRGGGGFALTRLELRYPPTVVSPHRTRQQPQLTATLTGEAPPAADTPVATLDMRHAKRAQRSHSMTITQITLRVTTHPRSNPIAGLDGALEAGSVIGTASLTANG